MIEFDVNNIEDGQAREALHRVREEINSKQVLLRGQWKFFEISINGTVVNYKYPHRLGFKPTDIIQTSIIGAGNLTWNYNEFDSINLDLSSTDECVVRAFIGRFEQEI